MYVQVRDVLDRIQELHRVLTSEFRSAGNGEAEEKRKMLLEWLGRHRQALEGVLAQARAKGGDGILNTWIQFPTTPSALESAKRLESVDKSDPKKWIEATLEVDRDLMELYDLLSTKLVAPSVQEFFADLKELEEKHRKELADVAQELGI